MLPFASTGKATPDKREVYERQAFDPDGREMRRYEREITDAVYRARKRAGREVVKGVTDNASAGVIIGRISSTDYERPLLQALRPLIVRVAQGGVAHVQTTFEKHIFGTKQAPENITGFNWDLPNERAATWAERYAGNLIKDISDVDRNRVRKMVAAHIESGAPMGDLRKQLTEVFDNKRRARDIATTETTSAFARGNQLAWWDNGVRNNTWNTSNDERVCPVCGPSHGETVAIGTNFKVAGSPRPPAHPKCRCWVTPDLKDMAGPGQVKPDPKRVPEKPKPAPQRDPERLRRQEKEKEKRKHRTGKEVRHDLLNNADIKAYEKTVAELDDMRDTYQDLLREQTKLFNAMQDALDAFGKDSSEYRAAKEAYQKVRKQVTGRDWTAEIKELEKRRNRLFQSSREAARNAIRVRDPGNRHWKSTYSTPKFNAVKGLDELNQMTSARVINRAIGEPSIKYLRGSQRAFYSQHGSRVNVTRRDAKEVIIHELGHWLEWNAPGVKSKAIAFLKKRVGTEGTRQLSQLTGNAEYRSDEVGWKDRFENPYMGKLYLTSGQPRVARRFSDYEEGSIRSTEIISMGVEEMYHDPIRFAESDPEYFDFIADVLRGN